MSNSSYVGLTLTQFAFIFWVCALLYCVTFEVHTNVSVSRVWSDILHLVEKRPALVEFYLSNLQLLVGNGGRIHFWEDKWFNNVCLKEEFPRLYSLSKEKDSTVQQIYCLPEEGTIL